MLPHVLILDDHREIARLIAAAATLARFRPVVVTDTEQARMELRSREFVAVLADVAMPGETGPQFVDWLKAQPALRELPVFFITADPSLVPDHLAKIVPIIRKPFRIGQIATALESCLLDATAQPLSR